MVVQHHNANDDDDEDAASHAPGDANADKVDADTADTESNISDTSTQFEVEQKLQELTMRGS